MKREPANWLPKWTKRIDLPSPDRQQVKNLLDEWFKEQQFIEKHQSDAFIIYGHIKRIEEIEDEVKGIYDKHKGLLPITFDISVASWVEKCFGEEVANNKSERNFRFFEEATELVQACDMTKEQCLQLVDYVYSRPKGEKNQEAGGVMVTLAALCIPNGISMLNAGEKELERIEGKIDDIRNKFNNRKDKNSPIP